MFKLSLSVFPILLLVEAKFYPSNVTDFSKCRQLESRSGVVYDEFFDIPESYRNEYLLDFHFSVRAESNAHILLAPDKNVTTDAPVYEIAIGIRNNADCVIRRKQKSDSKVSRTIRGLLSDRTPRSFWIHISKKGVIDVGHEGQNEALMSWTDPEPLPVKVYSFSTWEDINATWYLDCPRPTHSLSVRYKESLPLILLIMSLAFMI